MFIEALKRFVTNSIIYVLPEDVNFLEEIDVCVNWHTIHDALATITNE